MFLINTLLYCGDTTRPGFIIPYRFSFSIALRFHFIVFQERKNSASFCKARVAGSMAAVRL